MSSFYPSPPPHPQPRRVLSGGSQLEIPRSMTYGSPPHSHQQQQTSAPSQYPHVRYNPALYMGNSPSSPHTGTYGPPGRSAASPHRSGGEMGGYYNPQDYGSLGYGRVVTPPVQHQHVGDNGMGNRGDGMNFSLFLKSPRMFWNNFILCSSTIILYFPAFVDINIFFLVVVVFSIVSAIRICLVNPEFLNIFQCYLEHECNIRY